MVLRHFSSLDEFVFELDDRELNNSCIYSFIRPPRVRFLSLFSLFYVFPIRRDSWTQSKAQRNIKSRKTQNKTHFNSKLEAHRKCIAKEIKSEKSFNLNRWKLMQKNLNLCENSRKAFSDKSNCLIMASKIVALLQLRLWGKQETNWYASMCSWIECFERSINIIKCIFVHQNTSIEFECSFASHFGCIDACFFPIHNINMMSLFAF